MSLSYSRCAELEMRNGDCMTQEDFHSLYQQQPDGFKAELVDGTVFVSEPLGEPHSVNHLRLGSIIDAYASSTSGVHAGIEPTVILSKKDEVQPDLVMRVLPDFGGNTTDVWFRRGKKMRGPYIKGAPELVAEVAYSSRAIDLNLKKQRYEAGGIREYIV